MALLPGEILEKRYRIVCVLGEGAYGAVYRAWDTVDGRHYAVKEYLNPSAEIRQRFRTEAGRLNKLDHPRLPKVRDYFSLEDVGQYLVSDYVDGVDLQTLLDRYGPLPSDLMIDWLQAVCEPLDYLHAQKQLHLNVKPANIRITPPGDVFLVDTGLPGLGLAPGNPGFAAPEQQKQVAVSNAGDIYSLGATLYTLLTGKVPPAALRRESGVTVLSPAREVNPDVEPYLSLVANRALSLRPDTRYASVLDFARALERPHARLAETKPRDLRRSGTAATTAPPPKLPPERRRIIQTRTLWGLVIILLLLVLSVVSLTLIEREELVGGSAEAATATIQSQVVAALTAVAPTVTPTPRPTEAPTPTPAPVVSKTGMRMLFVPGGVFRYGNDDGDPDEAPSRLVNLDAFFIDETEVTNAQYRQCVDAGACAPPSSSSASYHPAYYGSSEYEDYPVVFINWYKADAFCKWREARLPNEVEWERAAGYDPQSLQRTLYPWGDEFDGERLNFCDTRCPREGRDTASDDGHQDTAPVGSYPAGRSHIGAADMLGNVMEWVADWYERDYYEGAPEINPRGPAAGEFKVLRGGSWFSYVEDLSVTRRGFFDPEVSRATLGFRCAMDMP